MPNEDAGDSPSHDSDGQALPQTPVPGTPQESEVRKHADNGPDSKESQTINLERDLRKGECWLIGINGAGVIINILIGLIYLGQLHQMQHATQASTQASETAASALKENERQFGLLFGQIQTQTQVAKEAADAAHDSLVLANRPWIKIKHRID